MSGGLCPLRQDENDIPRCSCAGGTPRTSQEIRQGGRTHSALKKAGSSKARFRRRTFLGQSGHVLRESPHTETSRRESLKQSWNPAKVSGRSEAWSGIPYSGPSPDLVRLSE